MEKIMMFLVLKPFGLPLELDMFYGLQKPNIKTDLRNSEQGTPARGDGGRGGVREKELYKFCLHPIW